MAGYEQDATIVVNTIPGVTTGITTLISGFASINQQFQNITNGISEGFGLVDATIISTGALVAKLGWDAAQAYGQFEQGMRIVQVVSNQGATAMEELSAKANQFSVQYRTDIDQITEGLQTLGRAGLNSAQEQTEVLQNGLQTAKLEGRQLNQVLEEVLQNTTLLGGDLRSSEFGEQSTYVNDLLVATSMTAPITSHDISQTLQYSGGLAATAGANIESEEGKDLLTDYMATIAAFAQKGVKGSLAGTALRAFLNKPATQDSSVVEGLSMIKLKPEYLWEEDGNTMKPISDQIALITGQMDKLNISQMDRLQIWSKILGGKMGQQMMKLEASDIKELTSDISSATNTQELANKSMNTFSQNLKQVEEQGQVVFRGIGEHIVKIINPILIVAEKVLEIFSNPIATFGLFAGGLALVTTAARKLWTVIVAVKDEFMLMRAMATEALQAITAQSAMSSASVSSLGNIMIGGKAGGLTAETNKINVLNEGLIGTKGLLGDIQMQALGLQGGGKLLPGQRYGIPVQSSVIGTETRTIQVPTIGGGERTVHQFRPFHVFDTQDPEDRRRANAVIDSVAQEKYEKYLSDAKRPDPRIDKNYFRQEVIQEIRRVGPNDQFGYMKGAWVPFNPDEEAFNAQEKYAWAMAHAKTGEPSPLMGDDERSAEEARAAAEEEVRRRKALGFRGRLREDLGRRLSAFEEEGRPYVDGVTSAASKVKNGIKNFGQGILNTQLPFQGNDIEKFQDFRRKKGSYLTRRDLNYLIDEGHLPKQWADSKLSVRDLNKAARGYWAAQDDPNARSDALGSLYNGLYKTERTIGTVLSGFRQKIGNISEIPTVLSNFRNRLGNVVKTYTPEVLSSGLQDGLRRGFTGLGDSIRGTISAFRRAREGIGNFPNYVVSASTKFQNGLERGFTGLGDGIRSLGARISGAKENIGSARIRMIELGASAREAAINLKNIRPSDIKKGISNASSGISLSGITGRLSRGASVATGAISGTVSKMLGGLGKGISTTIGAFSTITSYMGGPVMIAMMAFSSAMSLISKKMQEFGEQVNDAKEDVKNAYSQRNQAEDALRSAYSEQNPDSETIDIDTMVLANYDKIAKDMGNQKEWVKKIAESPGVQKSYEYDEEKDDGSIKEKEEETDEETELQKSIDENTLALYNATAKIMLALDKMVLKMNDNDWGVDGRFSKFSDRLGTFTESWGGFLEENSFTKSGGFLLSASQKDSNYPGYTEMPGLFLEDSYDSNGSLSQTMDKMFGGDAWKVMGSFNKNTKDFLSNMSQFSRGLGRANNSRLQASMMADKKTWQSLGKELAKYERKNKKSVGAQETKNSRLESLIKKLRIDTGLSRIQVLQAAYLQQMQDMYTVAEQVMVPLITQNATAAANTYILGQSRIAPLSDNTEGNTYNTALMAQSIASMLSTIAWAKSGEAAQNAAKMDPNSPLHELAMKSKDSDEFLTEAIKMEEGSDYGGLLRGIGQIGETVLDTEYGGILKAGGLLKGKNAAETLFGEKSMADVYEKYGITPLSKQKLLIGGGDKTGTDTILATFGGATYSTLNPGMGQDEANNLALEDIETLRGLGADYKEIYEWFGSMWGSPQMGEKIQDTYEMSGIGEPDSSSGGSGGSGSEDKDNNNGTRKERVDLVLCNRKTIPKLNVNLFKKPPSFTILNKNFKLRDVKINSEDKPKAIMAAIKNSFIDIQKRTDPKIIQDEDAVYDPAAATDGTNVPSGSAKTNTS